MRPVESVEINATSVYFHNLFKETGSFVNMEPNTGNSASAAGPKKDKKSKKNYEDGDGKKKFVSMPQVQRTTLL